MELSVIEADRILVYLGIFLAAFLITQTDQRRQRFAEGLAIAVTLVAFLGLASRLLPHVLEVSNGLGSGPRLRYPLGYWNANGALCGIAIALLLWMSRRALSATLRWLSVAAIPAVLLTLYFTYSRGGLLSLLIAVACLLALSRDRLWLLATLALGALGALPAVIAVGSRTSLADNLASQASVNQGVTVGLILIGGIALSLALYGALRRAERRGGKLTSRALVISRERSFLKRLGVAIVLLVIGAAIALGGQALKQFNTYPNFPSQPSQHFGQLSGAGREDFWRVAIDAFGEEPIHGIGAGTYQFAWDQHRSIDTPVLNAHSLYLEAFAELGVIGGLLVLALIGTLLWYGFSAWRAAPDSSRDGYAALFAAMLSFAVGAGLDWFWQIAGLGAIFFLAAGVLVGVRCAQLAPSGGARGRTATGRNYGLTVAGLALAWIAAIALIGPLLVEREIDASQSAAAGGNLASAVGHANTARSIEPWAASPYVQLGLLAELQGEYGVAIQRLSQAIEREGRNWELYYLRSKAERKAGDRSGAETDLSRARQLNPLESCLRGAGSCG